MNIFIDIKYLYDLPNISIKTYQTEIKKKNTWFMY